MTILNNRAQPPAGQPTSAATPFPDAPTHGAGSEDPEPDGGRRDDVLPVILGGDIGAYSLARSFHEAYGVRSVVVSPSPTGVVRRSQIVENVVEPRMDDVVCLVAQLREIARSTSATCLLLGSTDWYVRQIVEHRARLDDLFVIPYPRREILDQATDSEGLAHLCAGLGIAHLTSVVYDLAAAGPSWGGPSTDTLDYPVVAKAVGTSEQPVGLPGKRHAYQLGAPSELDALLAQLTQVGYTGRLLVQHEVGGDSHQRILTCYSDRYGRVRLASFGHVLPGRCTPGTLAAPAGVITARADEVVAQAVRLLEHLGWTGFSTFDIKVDPKDGTYHFVELNPRLGRSNHYLTAGGHNPATYYVTEHVDGRDVGALAPPDSPTSDHARLHDVTVATGTHLCTVVPHRLLLSYLDGPLRVQTAALIASGAVTNPLRYPPDRDPRRSAYLAATRARQFRTYRPRRAVGVSVETAA